MTRVAALLACWCSACSLVGPSVEECTSNAECQATFGFGFACGADGYCDPAFVAPRCTQTYPDDLFTAPETHRTTKVFGALFDRSVSAHVAREQSAQLALEQANALGGLEGDDFGIVFCTIETGMFDELSRTDAAVESARYLTQTLGLPAILGPSASTDAQAVFTATEGTGAVIVSPSATSTLLTTLDPSGVSDSSPGRLWRTAPPDDVQAAAVYAYLTGRMAPPAPLVVIHEGGAYGEPLRDLIVTPWNDRSTTDMNVMPIPLDMTTTPAAAAAMARTMIDTSPDGVVLFMSGQLTHYQEFLQAASSLVFPATTEFFFTDTAAQAGLLMGASPEVSALFDQIRGTKPAALDLTEPVFGDFVARYTTAYGMSPASSTFTAHSFDAAWLLAYATAWAELQEGGVSPAGIARGLRHVSSGSEAPLISSSWATVLAAFGRGEAVDARGASGTLDYDPMTEEIVNARIAYWTVSGGTITESGIFNP
jgi:ABC-type branched-subunit amino acid transport system substrate-binding protein